MTVLPITFVLDPGLTLEHLLGALHDPTRGRVAGLVTPRARRLTDLAADVLSAVGTKHHVGHVAQGTEEWRYAESWLVGYRTKHLFLRDGCALDGYPRRALLELAARLDVHVWLIFNLARPHRGAKDHIQEWGIPTLTAEGFIDRWSALRAGEERRPDRAAVGDDLPPLPSVDFTDFHSACRRLLVRGDFERFDAVWQDYYRRAFDALAASAFDEVKVVERVHGMIRSAPSVGSALVALRASQAVLFVSGRHLRVDAERFMADAAPQQAVGLDDPELSAILSIADPASAAAAVLALATTADAQELARLSIDDVSPDGAAVTLGNTQHPIADWAQPAVRAQLHMRATDPVGAETFLFVKCRQRDHAEPASYKSIQKGLRLVSQRTGLPLLRRHTIYRDTAAHAWWRRNGFVLQDL